MKKQRGMGDVGFIALALLVVFFFAGVCPYIGGMISCKEKAGMMGLQSKYGWWTGCMVKVGDRYAPINYIRIVDNKIIIQGDGE